MVTCRPSISERSDEELRMFVGMYGGGDVPVDTEVSAGDGALRMVVPGQDVLRLAPVGFNRFRVEADGGPSPLVVFEMADGRADRPHMDGARAATDPGGAEGEPMNMNPLSCRIPRMLFVGLLAATGCGEGPGPVQVDPETVVAEAGTPDLLVGRTTLALEHTVFEPCAAELVDVSGRVRLEVVARALDRETYALSWRVQATDVTGRAQVGDDRYRFTGAARGDATVARRDRAVTTADFMTIARASPGVDVHRPHVAPRMAVTLSVPVPVQGQLDGAQVEAVGFSQTCDP